MISDKYVQVCERFDRKTLESITTLVYEISDGMDEPYDGDDTELLAWYFLKVLNKVHGNLSAEQEREYYKFLNFI